MKVYLRGWNISTSSRRVACWSSLVQVPDLCATCLDGHGLVSVVREEQRFYSPVVVSSLGELPAASCCMKSLNSEWGDRLEIVNAFITCHLISDVGICWLMPWCRLRRCFGPGDLEHREGRCAPDWRCYSYASHPNSLPHLGIGWYGHNINHDESIRLITFIRLRWSFFSFLWQGKFRYIHTGIMFKAHRCGHFPSVNIMSFAHLRAWST